MNPWVRGYAARTNTAEGTAWLYDIKKADPTRKKKRLLAEGGCCALGGKLRRRICAGLMNLPGTTRQPEPAHHADQNTGLCHV